MRVLLFGPCPDRGRYRRGGSSGSRSSGGRGTGTGALACIIAGTPVLGPIFTRRATAVGGNPAVLKSVAVVVVVKLIAPVAPLGSAFVGVIALTHTVP